MCHDNNGLISRMGEDPTMIPHIQANMHFLSQSKEGFYDMPESQRWALAIWDLMLNPNVESPYVLWARDSYCGSACQSQCKTYQDTRCHGNMELYHALLRDPVLGKHIKLHRHLFAEQLNGMGIDPKTVDTFAARDFMTRVTLSGEDQRRFGDFRADYCGTACDTRCYHGLKEMPNSAKIIFGPTWSVH